MKSPTRLSFYTPCFFYTDAISGGRQRWRSEERVQGAQHGSRLLVGDTLIDHLSLWCWTRIARCLDHSSLVCQHCLIFGAHRGDNAQTAEQRYWFWWPLCKARHKKKRILYSQADCMHIPPLMVSFLWKKILVFFFFLDYDFMCTWILREKVNFQNFTFAYGQGRGVWPFPPPLSVRLL